MELPSDQHEEASYIIFKKNGNVFARNGETGDIEFSGTDAATVMQDAINALGANGGVITGKIEQQFEISSTIDPRDNLVLRNLRLRAADELNDNVIKSSAKRSNVTIKNCILDGNKANQTYTGNRADHTLVNFPNDDENIRIVDNELYDGLAGAAIGLGGPAINPHIEGNFIRDMGTSDTPCDGIFCSNTRGRIEGNWIKNVTDTPIANDDGQEVNVINNVIWNTDSWNTNISQASQGITPYAKTRNWEGRIEGNIIVNLGADADGITNYSDTGNEVRAEVIGNYLVADLHDGVYIGTDGHWCEISGNYIDSPSFRAIDLRAPESYVSNNIIRSPDDQAIAIVENRIAINGNRIKFGGANGIWIASGYGNLSVTGNVVTDCYDGIRLQENNTDCVVTGNRCYANDNYGIIEQTGGDYNIINANNCRGNTTGGVSTVGANTVATDNLP